MGSTSVEVENRADWKVEVDMGQVAGTERADFVGDIDMG